jgi:hypothetical protein
LTSRPTAFDRYFLGELYRKNNRFDRADSIYSSMLPDEDAFPATAVSLSRVRLLVQREEYQQANDLYWKAVQSVADDFDADFVKRDLLAIVDEKEYLTLFKQSPWFAVPEVLRAFWFSRDPIPSYSYNFRLIEHYRRLVNAEKSYTCDQFYRSTFLNDYRATDYIRKRGSSPLFPGVVL